MEARMICATLIVIAFLSTGAGYRTENFIVSCSDPDFAAQVAEEAERLRKELAIEWLGEELPPWQDKCPIVVHFEPHASGRTSFGFAAARNGRGYPVAWDMEVAGSPERILDAVLPHEVTHTIFATHFGQRLPRWADEGACTTVEHESEKEKHRVMLVEFLSTRRGIPFNRMFRMMEYPSDMLPLYAQGFSVAQYLIEHHGKQHFVDFIEAGLEHGDWDRATSDYYGYDDLSDLQVTWNDWVRQGSRLSTISPRKTELLADRSSATNTSTGRQLAPAEGFTPDGESIAPLPYRYEGGSMRFNGPGQGNRGTTPAYGNSRQDIPRSGESWYFEIKRDHIQRRSDGGITGPTQTSIPLSGTGPIRTGSGSTIVR